MSECEIWVQFDCLHVKLLGSLVILQQRIGIAGDLIRAQIKNVRIRISGRFGGNELLFLASQCCSQLLSDGLGDFAFDRKNVRQFAIKRVRPNMGIVSGLDQLNVHPNGIATLLYTSFQNVSYAKLLRNLRQVVRSAFVMLRRRTRDHLQIGDLG